jgi:hypothetical protein
MRNVRDLMTSEIQESLATGETIEDIEDRSNELVDSYLPIYNGDILEEWSDMPSEYDDRGAQELGADESMGIIGRMSLDLYLYYADVFSTIIEQIKEDEEGEE